VAAPCEHGNESSDSIKVWEILDQLSVFELLKKDSAQCTWLVIALFKNTESRNVKLTIPPHFQL
jgi:hypothetical protein